jgi:hypothetical protein
MPDNLRDEILEVIEVVAEAQLQAIRKLRQPRHMQRQSERRKRIKRMSHLDIVHDILQGARRPLHISEILELAAGRFKVDLDRDSVVSALAKQVARKNRFMRTAPNTFALLSENR